MKAISFRIIALCILLPPICYGFTIQGLEYYLSGTYRRDIEQVCVGNTAPLFKGTVRLRDAINSNIDRYLQHQRLLSWGVKATVWVTAGKQMLLYPAPIENDTTGSLFPEASSKIASENYALLRNGLSVTVDVQLPFGHLLANVILGSYILLAMFFLYGVYRVGVRKTRLADDRVTQQLKRLLRQERELSGRLAELKADRERVSTERDRLEKTLDVERQKAGSAEADLFEEIVKLDGELTQNLKLQEQQQAEIKTLSEKIETYEKEQAEAAAPKTREADILAKRFGALYKNISVHERAVEGFAGLTEEMKIKGEEVIHRLNEAPDQVTIKRKVFSGKGRAAVLEVLFAYNGRLYFSKSRDHQIEVLAVGTKNTQSRDLAFIDKISRKG